MAGVAEPSRLRFFWHCINPNIKKWIFPGYAVVSLLTWLRDELFYQEYGALHLRNVLPNWPLSLWVTILLAILIIAIGEGLYQQSHSRSETKSIYDAGGNVYQRLPTRSRLNSIGVPCAIVFAIVLLWVAYPAWWTKAEPNHAPTVEQSKDRPHIAMTPSLEMIGNQATVMVMFHNRGKEDVDKLTLKIILNDGEKFNESLREVPILRADINRKMFVMILQDLYVAVIAGKESLKVRSSAAYSLHGAEYAESCTTKWNASMRLFDYLDC